MSWKPELVPSSADSLESQGSAHQLSFLSVSGFHFLQNIRKRLHKKGNEKRHKERKGFYAGGNSVKETSVGKEFCFIMWAWQ
jgi:hypothetical protein